MVALPQQELALPDQPPAAAVVVAELSVLALAANAVSGLCGKEQANVPLCDEQ